MNENEFILFDRLEKIRTTIAKYGEDNFYMAYSGGKDSVVLSKLLDMAVPNNNIPRIYADTGIELNLIRNFVLNQQLKDNRIIMLKPSTPIIQMLKNVGYPFKSKSHSEFVARYQKSGLLNSVKQYLGIREDKKPWSPQRSCPKCLEYQFKEDFNIKISDKCCDELKEKPVKKWVKLNGKKYGIVGIMASEGGRRVTAKCMVFKDKKSFILKNFQPLAPLTKEWENWFINEYNIEICKIYNEPYNFDRTGCKGCPFNTHLQRELDILEMYFPDERKQCEIIWKPVYEEYRRIGYRLKDKEK